MRFRDYYVLSILATVPRLILVWLLPLGSGSLDPNCAPDEFAHFWVAREASLGHFDGWSPGAMSIYAAFPPIQYAAQAATLALGSLLRLQFVRYPSPEPLLFGYGYARLGSVILGVATVALVARVTWELTRSRKQALIAGVVGALLPQLVFVNAYVNADSFTIAVGALCTLAVVRWYSARAILAPTPLLGAALGLVLVAKLSGYYIIPPTLALVIVRLSRETASRGRVVAQLVASCCVIAGPILVWNAMRTGGDPLGTGAYAEFVRHYWQRGASPGPHPVWIFFERVGMSTFGTFRNMDLFLPDYIYQAALLAVLIGIAISSVGWRHMTAAPKALSVWLVTCALLNLALVGWNSWIVDFQPQGRYWLLSALCLGVVAVVGPTYVLPRAVGNAWSGLCIAVLVAGMAEGVILIYQNPCLP